MKSNAMIDLLKFPSGRSVKRCRVDAKQLLKTSKQSPRPLSHSEALDYIARKNGVELPWHQALQLLQKQPVKPFEDKKLFEQLLGRTSQLEASYKAEVVRKFSRNGRIFLPDGEGGIVEVFSHRADPKGVLITNKVTELVERDIERLGGLETLNQGKDGGIQLFYEVPGSTSHLAYEFHFTESGTIHYFCRSQPWNEYEAELHVRGYSITNVGYGIRPVDTALHWVGFAIFHRLLVPKVF